MDMSLKIALGVFIGYAMCMLFSIHWRLLTIRVENMRTNMMLETLVEIKTKEIQLMLRVQEMAKKIEES